MTVNSIQTNFYRIISWKPAIFHSEERESRLASQLNSIKETTVVRGSCSGCGELESMRLKLGGCMGWLLLMRVRHCWWMSRGQRLGC